MVVVCNGILAEVQDDDERDVGDVAEWAEEEEREVLMHGNIHHLRLLIIDCGYISFYPQLHNK